MKKGKLFNYDESPAFNAFIHIGMIVKILSAIGMIAALWYFL